MIYIETNISKNKIKPLKFLFIGRTASGKSSIAKAVCDKMGLTQVISYTTRPMRKFEQIESSDVYVIDPIGVDNLKIKCGDKYDFVEIYIRTPQKLAETRARMRGDKLKDFKERWVSENKQFTDYENRHTFAWHLRNDRPFDESVDKVCSWIHIELDKRNEVVE